MTTANPARTLDGFREAMRAACERALDAGLRYDDEFNDAVMPEVQQHDPAEPDFRGLHEMPDDREAGWQRRKELGNMIRAAPRGTWLIYSYKVDGKTWYRRMLSAGDGQIATGGNSQAYEAPPSWETVYGRMISFEICTIREEVEQARKRARDRAALEALGAQAGSVFRKRGGQPASLPDLLSRWYSPDIL
jgi:hypothetical protein